jgi:hypothetical protein
MQYWIFYEPTLGGRNFARLLENADNMQTADGFAGWRSKSAASNNYAAASWASFNGISCSPFIDTVNTADVGIQLNPIYQSIIENGQNTVILAHYRYFDEINNFVHKNLVQQNQVKINLYTDNDNDSVANKVYAQQMYNNYHRQNYGTIENLKSVQEIYDESDPIQKQSWINEFKTRMNSYKNSSQFDLQLDVDLLFNHFNYANTQLQSIGITIDESLFANWRSPFV